MLAAIEAAFDGVPFPGPAHHSLFQAEETDHRRSCDQSRDHTGRWQDLPPEHVEACPWALPHLDAHGMQYHLPAILTAELREQVRKSHTLEFTVRRTDDNARQFVRFTDAQRAAVARFVEHAVTSRDAKRVRRAGALE